MVLWVVYLLYKPKDLSLTTHRPCEAQVTLVAPCDLRAQKAEAEDPRASWLVRQAKLESPTFCWSFCLSK